MMIFNRTEDVVMDDLKKLKFTLAKPLASSSTRVPIQHYYDIPIQDLDIFV